jgi:hypothetical protein
MPTTVAIGLGWRLEQAVTRDETSGRGHLGERVCCWRKNLAPPFFPAGALVESERPYRASATWQLVAPMAANFETGFYTLGRVAGTEDCRRDLASGSVALLTDLRC